MSKRNALFPEVKEHITFDTLWQQASSLIDTLSGTPWSNRGDQDPGVTLLQAVTYNVSDLSYRHALSLNDLLTTDSQELFPQEFGPQQMLTCAPVTIEDYRRALLDMHSSELRPEAVSSGFLFNNAQLVKEEENERPRWWYDTDQRVYTTIEPPADNKQFKKLTLSGNYWLYLWPSRYLQQNPDGISYAEIEKKLKTFFNHYRNIGENVSRVLWPLAAVFSPRLTITLNDDIDNPARVAADIFNVLESALFPAHERATIDTLRQQGWQNEDIYEGPALQHGWQISLPASPDVHTFTISLAPVIQQLLAIDGIKTINHLSVDNLPAHIQKVEGDDWSWKVDYDYYPQLWGADPLTLLSSAESPLQLIAKGGITVTLNREDIVNALTPEPLVENPQPTMPAGDRRDLTPYTPVATRLPACYHSQEYPDEADSSARPLHQFLLPIDQLLADACANLGLLPKLLSFNQRDSTIRGTQWPYDPQSVSQAFHEAYAQQLQQLKQREVAIFPDDNPESLDNFTREIAIIRYLLSYFGSENAARPLTLQYDDFLASQRGFLAQQPELGYRRFNMPIGAVSALQKRLAARIGLGGECFQEPADLSKLPFYMVEHRQLLPNNMRDDTLINATFYEDHQIFYKSRGSFPLSVGENYYLTEKESDGSIGFHLPATVDALTNELNYFQTNITDDLKSKWEDIKTAADNNKLYWRKFDKVWLQDMDYQLNYADSQEDIEPDQRRLASSAQSPFPFLAKEGDVITLRTRPKEDNKNNAESITAENEDILLTAKIIKLNAVEGTLIIEKNADSANDFPTPEEAWRYIWYFSEAAYATEDRFSFVISVVHNRRLLEGEGIDPQKLSVWLQQTILDDFPAHVTLISHWMDEDTFQNFGLIYQRWQQNGAPFDDDNYRILQMLTLGHKPTLRIGIGMMRIANEDERTEAIGTNGDQWNEDIISKNELFNIPPNQTH